MAKELSNVIDTQRLFEEVRISVKQDKLYELQNKAKINAASDPRLSSYEEFRDRVNAAHLKPLGKKDRIEDFNRIWNPISSSSSSITSSSSISSSMESSGTLRLWERLLPHDRYIYMKENNAFDISLNKKELPVGFLGKILEALSDFPNTTDDVIFVVRLLEDISQTERFKLGLDFLTCCEKDTIWLLMDKISKSFNNRHQDLAEQGVTEWTVKGLREKYCVPSKRFQD